MMNEQTLYSYLRRCLGSQLDEITIRLDLDGSTLPGRNEPVATRAAAILNLVAQRPDGFQHLERLILEMFRLRVADESSIEGQRVHRDQLTEPSHRAKVVGHTVLVLAANPFGTTELQLDQEIQEIQNALAEGSNGHLFKLHSAWAVRPEDLSKYLLQYAPTIVHFCGHGSPEGQILLEDAEGLTKPVDARSIAMLFQALGRTVECVILNACYSSTKAMAISRAVNYVIGMAQEVGDRSAIEFAKGFYRGISFGKDFETAFRLGCCQIDLLSLPDPLVPRIASKGREWVAFRETGAEGKRSLPVAASQRSSQAEQQSRLYTVWYGTNRLAVDPQDRGKGFGGERDPLNKLHYGTCEVVIPKWHVLGSVGSTWFMRWITRKEDRLTIVRNRGMERGSFCEMMRADLDDSNGDLLVFVHGYNVSFDTAALRAAQIGFDLQVNGITAFFSWPSKGVYQGYAADTASVEASEGLLADFLTMLVRESGAKRVHVIAHSMGNRALLRSLQSMMSHSITQRPTIPFGQLILAAPDVDSSLFREVGHIYTCSAERTTLYVSDKDKALSFSGFIHDFSRAGYWPTVTIVPGIDTIEVQNVDFSFLGHGYFAAVRDLLGDIYALIRTNADPNSRFGLKPSVASDGQPYWVIQA